MNPRAVFLIRHAEKPDPAEASTGLSAQGRIRAAAIPSLFYDNTQPDPARARFPRPDALFATRATERSNRPAETLFPLSRVLNRPVDDRYRREDYRELAREILSPQHADHIILVSWHRRGLQELAQALGVAAAPVWPDTRFDRLWLLQWNAGEVSFRNLPQNLLPGDSPV